MLNALGPLPFPANTAFRLLLHPRHLDLSPMAQANPTRVRLGDFELNLETGEIQPFSSPDGLGRTILREQPFQILKLLIERPGKIVSRDEIRKTLWSDDTIVDYDHSISVAIRVLRKTLGDSADNPRYIETIASRGYRLLVEVEPQFTTAGVRPEDAQPESSPAGGDLVGKKVSHYRVLGILGGGGMGMVYRAEDLKLGRSVALKFLSAEIGSDERALRRFEREARTASALNHANICTIFEIEEHDGQPFIVMELLEGQTLRQRLDTLGRKGLPLPELLDLTVQVCRGLQAAHDKGIVHRDIKPANIFLTNSGTVKILDFGVAKLVAQEDVAEPVSGPPAENHKRSQVDNTFFTTRETAIGTAGYMSPEQIRRENLDRRSDLFSLGTTLYEAATGRRAFTGATEDQVREAVLSEVPASARTLNAAIPPAFDAILARAMQKAPSLRPQSAAEIEQEVERVQNTMRSGGRHVRGWLFACGVLVLAVACVLIYRRVNTPPLVLANDTVVLAVTNQTGDPVFDQALYMASLIALQQTPYMNVLASFKVSEALGEFHLSPAPWISPQIARQVCLRTGSKLVIASSIGGAGNDFRVETDGIDCQSGKAVASVQQRVAERSSIIRTLGLCLVQLRRKLGEPAVSVRKFNQPLDAATSSSPEALQLLVEGYTRQLSYDRAAALSDYQRASTLDPQFALPYAAEAILDRDNGNLADAAAASRKAYELRDRQTLPSRLHVDEEYYENAIGDIEKDCSLLGEWASTYPADFIAHNNHASCLQWLGRPDEVLAEAREAARLFPSAWSYRTWMSDSLEANRLDEAMSVYQSAQARHFDRALFLEPRFELAFLKDDGKTMQEQLDWSRSKPAEPNVLSDWALAQAQHGHRREALQSLRRVKELDAGKPTTACMEDFNVTPALWDAEMGFTQETLQVGRQILQSEKMWGQRMRLALAFALAGDFDHAQEIADSTSREFPQDTLVQNYQVPVVEAAIMIRRDNAAGAVDVLRKTLPYDLSINCASIDHLQSVYVRGLAYLEMKQGSAALVEFQKIQDHLGIVAEGPIGAMSLLQMGRAYELVGNRTAAKQSYKQFLSIWEDADPDIPIYQEAKTEYEELQHGVAKRP
jgi:eukaryotic-like serine/threonine-protein kinase